MLEDKIQKGPCFIGNFDIIKYREGKFEDFTHKNGNRYFSSILRQQKHALAVII